MLFLDQGEDLPPPSPVHKQSSSGDTWTIIGANGEKFTTSIKDIESGTRKASITSAQVERLLDYVKHNAPHLKLEKVKPGVLKLIKIPEAKQKETAKAAKPQPAAPPASAPPAQAQHKIKLKKQNDNSKKIKPKEDLEHDNYWSIKENKEEKIDFMPKHPNAKGPMIHFDLSNIAKDKPDLMEKAVHVYKDGPPATAVTQHTTNHKSGKLIVSFSNYYNYCA